LRVELHIYKLLDHAIHDSFIVTHRQRQSSKAAM